MKKTETLTHGFPPFYTPDSRLLILGSFPSVKSREQQFYYGHPQNRFWKVLGAVYGCDPPDTLFENGNFSQRIKSPSGTSWKSATYQGRAILR